ncbi:DUF4873 domain-containing protein [Rhodococcus sp. Z13]|uniref:DUF4873 domain-containing protein n=1 Tax=Rhodococcus sacchari TaxID=2962047 RepID=A0ACD4DDS4_9NOCA|nr:DUF4873 domain-containing protein [Rhodococcus sp. Z13]UYP18186.1 DUF4873 domain-containing protein [Rhodococcus sp. Z13]
MTEHEDDLHDDAPGYRGPAEVTVGERSVVVDVEISGRFDPLLGRHVWRGRLRRLAEALGSGASADRGTTVTLTVPGAAEAATARVTEIDLWGSHMVDGLSRPPYPLPTDEDGVDPA